jgi:ribonuclease HI
LIKYQLDQTHEYWVRKSNIKSLDTDPAITQEIENNTRGAQTGDREGILIYTDGASSGNPGPAGIGVVMRFGHMKKKYQNISAWQPTISLNLRPYRQDCWQ